MEQVRKTAKHYISFSRPINHLVVAAFGAAFVLIYAASAVLLYLAEGNTATYYIEAGVMFIVYLALYVIASLFISRRIWSMFIPLDRLAIGLIRDEVFVDSEQGDLKALAESLRRQAQHMADLTRELRSTQANLQDASRESRENKDEQYLMMSRCLVETERMQKKKDDMDAQSLRLEECIAGALPLEQEIKEKRSRLYDLTLNVEETVRSNLRQHQDMETEFGELTENYALLDHMHADAGELIETIYSELSAIQAAATQVNLFAVNTSLDIARGGTMSISAISALDEIKELTGKLTAKTDDVQLLVIRIRNALKLAQDQTGECRGKGEECGRSFEDTGDTLGQLSEQVRTLLETNDEISESVSRLTGSVYEMKLIEERREREAEKMSEASYKLQKTVREWKQSSTTALRSREGEA